MNDPKFALTAPPIVDAAPGEGLDWAVMEIIARAPMRLMPYVVQFLVGLRQSANMRSTVHALAKRLKTTEAKILECAAHVPQVVELSGDGRTAILRTARAAPWELDPKALEDLEKRAKADVEKRKRQQARAERDQLDTPFNKLRLGLEEAGMTLDDARNFAGFLVRTYGHETSAAAIELAKAKQPHDAKSFIIGIIKSGLRPARTTGFSQTIKMTTRPTGSGRTEFIGWEDCERDGIRQKLYRLPDGTLRRIAPNAGEPIPSFASDAGFKVAA